jgi:large repetitive protein
MRVFRTACAIAAVAGVFAASAFAFGFTDEALMPPDLQVGVPYSFQLSARSGCPPYSFEKQSGYFPPGVSMTSDGLISGTPQLGGTYQAWLAVKNQCPGDSSERLFTFYVADPAPFFVRFGGFFAATQGKYYMYDFRSTEGGVLTWTLNRGVLPEGMKIAPTGLLTGIPREAGLFVFRVKVNDGRRTTTGDFTLQVVRRLALATGARLPATSLGRHFSVKLRVRGGVPPYRWQVAHGKVPRGVRFAYGTFSGTPRTAGTSRVTVRVLDAQSAMSMRTFVLSVKR